MAKYLGDTAIRIFTKEEILKSCWTAGYMSLYQSCGQMPNHGVGAKFWRKTWPENSYWTLTQVDLKDPGHGKAFGKLTWKGVESDKIDRVRSPLKRGVWQYEPAPNNTNS